MNKAVKEIEAETKLVYGKASKKLNLGNLKVSKYKFNKFVNIPRPKSVRSEAINEVQRKEMIRVCEEIKV